MTAQAPVVAITGANGYLGSRICESLQSQGWKVIRLVRSPRQGQDSAFVYDLAMPVTAEVKEALRSADALVHAAYDLSLTRAADIWQVNVEGTRRLLEAAADARVEHIVVLSSMSAFEGTSQLYGQSKLDIEAITVEFGGCAVRPGLVYGERAGGMAGALRRLTFLPVIPVIAGGAGLYTVCEDDLMMAIAALTAARTRACGTISVAHPSRVPLADLMRAFSARGNRKSRLVFVPWKLVYGLLRTGELIRLPLPFRADSLLGLIHSAPNLSGTEKLTALGVSLRPFSIETTESHTHQGVT